MVATPKRPWAHAILACHLLFAAESWATNHTTHTTLDIVVIAEEDILARTTPVGIERIKSVLKKRIAYHAEQSQRYVLIARSAPDHQTVTVFGCTQVEETCLRQYRESRSLGRVVSAEIRNHRVRLMGIDASATRDSGWHDLPSDEPALSRAIDNWAAEMFDARSVIIVQLAKAGAGMSQGGGPSDWNAKVTANGADCRGARCTVKPGSVLVRVEAAGMETKRESFEIEAWAVRVVDVTLVPLNHGGASSPSGPAVKTRVVRSKALLWTAIGTAVAGVATMGIGFYYGGKVSETEADIARLQGAIDEQQRSALDAQAETRRVKRDLGFIGGGVAIGAASVMAIVYAVGGKESVVAATVTSQGAGLAVLFKF